MRGDSDGDGAGKGGKVEEVIKRVGARDRAGGLVNGDAATLSGVDWVFWIDGWLAGRVELLQEMYQCKYSVIGFKERIPLDPSASEKSQESAKCPVVQ